MSENKTIRQNPCATIIEHLKDIKLVSLTEYIANAITKDIDNRGISVAKSKLVRFLVVGIVVLVLLSSGEVFAQETSEPKWVLAETLFNPENKPTEFIVGVTPNFFSSRFDGSFDKYTIEETYFIHKSYWKDHVGTPSESLESDVEMRADFTKPPEILVPGEKITLKATVSATGTSPGRGSGIIFEYRADGINLRDTTQVSTGSNSEPPFSTYSISPYFVVPETHSGEISIVAFLWNAGAVNVRWIYRAQDSTPTDITPPPTDLTTSGTSTTSICGQENLFKNPDFENVDHSSSAGLVASKWSAYWYPEMNSVTDAHSGSYSLKVSNNPGKTSPYNNYDGVKQDFYPTLSKDHYTMSCWLRSASGALALEMGMSDSNFGVPHSSKKFTITETWKRYEYSDHASPGRTYIRLTGASGTFYIDDCDLCLTASVQQTTPSSSSTETPTPTDITPTPTGLPLDDFNDNAINPALWVTHVVGSGPTVAETNQRVEITFPADSSGVAGVEIQAGYDSVCELRGDFDIQVDYELLVWPNANGVRVGLLATGAVERVSFGSSSDFPGEPREVYLTHFADGVQGITATSDLSGKLRLVRNGNMLTGYYFNSGSGNWITIHSATTTTADTPFSIAAWSGDDIYTDQEVKIAFDNFVVNHGELICPSTTPPPPEATPTKDKGMLPGFTAIFAIAGMLAVAYLALRRRQR